MSEPFYEIIESLIDVRLVPEGKRCGEGYKAARDDIHDNLATIEDVAAGCYHEAGHLIYATNFGLALSASVSEFKILGPHIAYHLATDTTAERYEPTPMAISVTALNRKVRDTSDNVLEMAKIGVAGGESIEFFRNKLNKPMWKRGDKNDEGRFKDFCEWRLLFMSWKTAHRFSTQLLERCKDSRAARLCTRTLQLRYRARSLVS